MKLGVSRYSEMVAVNAIVLFSIDTRFPKLDVAGSILPHEWMASLASELARVASDPIPAQHYTENSEGEPMTNRFRVSGTLASRLGESGISSDAVAHRVRNIGTAPHLPRP